MRDYFLLGDGEYFRSFLDKNQLFYQLPLINIEENLDTLNKNWKSCVSLKSDSYERKKSNFFRFFVWGTLSEKENQVNPSDAWGNYVLDYMVSSPMHLLFTREILLSYQKIFSFLFTLKRLQMQLNSFNKSFLGNSFIWQNKSQRCFFFDQLLSYLQIDVIESNYQNLLDQISNSNDFEMIKRMHENFVQMLLQQSLLASNTVIKIISKIISNSSSFSNLIRKIQSNPQLLQHSALITQLENLNKDFLHHLSLLSTILTSKSKNYQISDPSQFILRLDFNGWISNMTKNEK